MGIIAIIKKNYKRKPVFEIFFIAALLLLGLVTFLTLFFSHGASQRNIFFSDKNDTFMDFFNPVKYSSLRDPYHSTYFPPSEKAYLPLSYMLLYPFSKFFDYANIDAYWARSDQLGLMSVVIFLLSMCMALAFLLYEMKNGSKAIRFFTVLALFASGISIFSLERANIVYMSVIALAFFMMFYKSENKILRELSLIALAFATVLKAYPVLFAMLLITERRWKDVARLIGYGLMATFLPFFFFKGGLTIIPVLLKNFQANSSIYMLNVSAFKFGFTSIGVLFGWKEAQLLNLSYFSVFLLAVAVLTSWSLNKFWKNILLLTCAIVVSPVNSEFYSGLFLFIPIILFLNEQDHSLFDWIYLGLMIVVLNPYQISSNSDSESSILSNYALILTYALLLVESVRSTIRVVFPHPVRFFKNLLHPA